MYLGFDSLSDELVQRVDFFIFQMNFKGKTVSKRIHVVVTKVQWIRVVVNKTKCHK